MRVQLAATLWSLFACLPFAVVTPGATPRKTRQGQTVKLAWPRAKLLASDISFASLESAMQE